MNFIYYALKMGEIHSPPESIGRSVMRVIALFSIYGGYAFYAMLALSRIKKFDRDYPWVTVTKLRVISGLTVGLTSVKPLAELLKAITGRNNPLILIGIITGYIWFLIVKHTTNILITRAVLKNVMKSGENSSRKLVGWIGLSIFISFFSVMTFFLYEQKGPSKNAGEFFLCMVIDIEASATYAAECVFQILLAEYLANRKRSTGTKTSRGGIFGKFLKTFGERKDAEEFPSTAVESTGGATTMV